ncbi:MAG: septum formation initiator [Bacteroidetes bacterium GWC2_33_15]|nr:MAG: septum formation initiator [Bacteroidetes bacterium GWA2_33_15]OFX51652.1 MAG: septum formation initiator [Bacteroidetes bacterium GWC2_33_15]OFX66286.1 MAG: septum formation initiator [Bacteroidetes bacterium GWB2_32_14]OFX66952.1 MAG: septum formation initiator [Bacteroidetes bacterium GWD2_33_33]
MSTLNRIIKKLIPYFKNKYILTLFIFVLWLLFFDRNNLIDRVKEIQKLRQFEKDREYYIERIETDSKRLKQLKTNNKNLEKFAREQYFMKKDNEEIFVIIEE